MIGGSPSGRPRSKAGRGSFSTAQNEWMLAEIYPLRVLLLTVSGIVHRHQADARKSAQANSSAQRVRKLRFRDVFTAA